MARMSLVRTLLQRRFPQIMAAYLAISWGLVQFVDWLVSRYALSSALVDFVGALLLLLLPTVGLVAFFHGAPGRDRWTRLEKLAIPANLLVAGTVLAIAFGGRNLGATTTTVVVEDEEGNVVERVVPKSEYRRHLALFYFDNESGDPELDWLQYGVPAGLWVDLRQDPFLDVRFGLHMANALRQEGRPEGLGLPLTLKNEIAEQQHVEYLLAGRLTTEGDTLQVTTSLHEVATGKLVKERTFSGTEPFEVIDRITAQLKEDLAIPAQRLQETRDLPAEELLTTARSAFEAYVRGFRAFVVESDYETAGAYLTDAVTEDPSFAIAHALRYAVLTLGNRSAEAQESLAAAMEHSYRLPEREQLQVKREYLHVVKQDPERAIAVARMATDLFPEDVEALGVLAQYQILTGLREEAIASFLRILALDPAQTPVLLVVGQLYESLGRFEEALDYLDRYAELFPDDMRSYQLLAGAHRGVGDHEAMRQACERALLIEPNDVPARLCLAVAAADLGEWDAALEGFEEALGSARTAADRARVHSARRSYYSRRGQLAAGIAERGREISALTEAGEPTLLLLRRRIQTLELFARGGQAQAAIDSAASIRAQIGSPFDQLAALGEMEVYSELRDPEGLETALESAEEMIANLGFELYRPTVTYYEARLDEIRDECEAAIDGYERALELEPTAVGWKVAVGRCLRKLGLLDEAAVRLLEVLDLRPYHAGAHYQLALVRLDQGDGETAREHLETALGVWAEADPAFEPAREARAALRELGVS